ncbi:aKG-HExxH-type peptide beta-hydroxylase [Streptomyces sp. P1-3]|uniref:aKG-HExxH-type peptide beta-hydroxylase n=1 Tax=Streptomyces sp. P1-3 TaxID=3421658 RepID=UPI003D3626E9
MGADIPADAYAEIVAVGPTPKGTVRLARSYHRGALDRLAPHLGESPSVTCLHPRAVWAGEEIRAGRKPDQECLDAIRADLARARTGIPPLEHVTGHPGYPQWCRGALDDLRSDILKATGAGKADLAAAAAPDAADHVEEAARVLRRVWPEAALECDVLVRAVVYVGGGAFRSATLLRTYGAVYAGAEHLATPPAAFEMLLHETGHHSLYLRNAFEVFVVNGDDMVSHPLRPDPRPVSGTLHAAHVLARMAAGLNRWWAEPGAPAEVRERRDEDLARLHAAVSVLKGAARWTPAGEDYFENLLRWERELTESCA